ncbi:hypothetical protein Pcinc_041434 [Petrolisthes cinctipes]|uniref:Ig-like domain-containing protein n=1 Tax=Petrolisthes cinctipes TaxID=88211 RepID=A0AAE1EHT0_PETCI|nr:hypothetical protein Pcinc_041434 [Petrolisthes cinctipes]
MDRGIINLQKLFMRSCRIESIEPGSFNMLSNLVELDLSYNLLKKVPTRALVDLPRLLYLRLQHNALESIPVDAFAPVSGLIMLDLSYNQIHSLNINALRCLSGLRSIGLAGNTLQYLPYQLLVPLQELHALEIDNNPFVCNCRLRNLRQWMLTEKVSSTVSPVCAKPKRLAGSNWDTLEAEDFVCLPQATVRFPRVTKYENETVSLVCQISADVLVNVSWFGGKEPLRSFMGSKQRYQVQQQLTANRTSLISNLTISKLRSNDARSYRCVAENREGKSETRINLIVKTNKGYNSNKGSDGSKGSNSGDSNRLESDNSAMKGSYMTLALLGGLGMLVAILLLVSCIIHRRERVRKFKRQEEDREGRENNYTTIDRSIDRTKDRTMDRTMTIPSDRTATTTERLAAERALAASDRVIDRAIDRAMDRTTMDRATDRPIVSDRTIAAERALAASDRVIDRAIDRAMDRTMSADRTIASDRGIDRAIPASDRVIDRAIDRAMDRTTMDRATDRPIKRSGHASGRRKGLRSPYDSYWTPDGDIQGHYDALGYPMGPETMDTMPGSKMVMPELGYRDNYRFRSYELGFDRFKPDSDSHYLDSHYLDSHYLDSHYLDSHYLDSHYLDSH